MSSYDTANAKYNEVTSNNWTVTDYGTAVNFAQRVDLSVAGVIMDCGECHVGGGGNEYVPFSPLSSRVPLRNIATTPVNGGTAITDTMYTAFNYFIDTYDVDHNELENEVKYMDYSKTGVMEMDCLLCHLPGYDYAQRTYLLRQAKIDATRPVAAGFATANPATWAAGAVTPADPGYGTLVTYDESQFDTAYVNNGDDYTGFLTLPGTWLSDNLAGKPDSTNCAFCHMNKPGVDWKKRGDNWPATVTSTFYNDATNGEETHSFEIPSDFTYEVHQNIGCMGCHERKPTASQPNLEDIDWTGSSGYATMGTGLLGHDPAKGSAPFSSLYNNNDFAAFKKCQDCHVNGGVDGTMLVDTDGDLVPDSPIKNGESYAAPNPNAAHAAAGLTAKIVQATGSVAGTPAISHIDLMDCSTCHSRKINSFAWENTGNPLVDATGGDVAGRMTDHENEHVIKTDMTDRSGLGWYQGKLIRTSYLNTMFWRDKNDTTLDANMDTRGGGMDALLMTQVNKVNEANGWTSITADSGGNVTPTLIDERVAAMAAEITNWTGSAGAPAIKLSMMLVAFKDQHGVSPARLAWGSGAGNDPLDPADDNANGCLDCHSSGANFYNASVNTTGDGVTISWNNDMAPFTVNNGATEYTDMHPSVKDKFNVRSLSSRVTGLITSSASFTEPVALPIAATMYEETFMTRAPFADVYDGNAINFSTPATEAGWLFMVEARSTAPAAGDDGVMGTADDIPAGTITSRTRGLAGGTDVTDTTGLMTALGATFTGAMPEFTISTIDATRLRIAAKSGFQIRLKGGVDNSGSFGLGHAAYVAMPWTGINQQSYAGRADWVAYLNDLDGSGTAIDPANYGIGVDPVAAIDNIGGNVDIEVGSTVQMVANTAQGAGFFSYSWICNDSDAAPVEGVTADKTFNTIGVWTVTLNVIDEEGKLAQAHQQVNVVPAAAGTTISSTDNGVGAVQTITFGNLPSNDELYIIWGDGQKVRLENTGSPATLDVNHTFLISSKYDKGAYYEYKVTVYVYNTADFDNDPLTPDTQQIVETKQAFIQIFK